jgi:hypothetical protein
VDGVIALYQGEFFWGIHPSLSPLAPLGTKNDPTLRYSLSNEWIANRPAMGHPAAMSKVVKLYQESKEGEKMMTKYEKILKSKD